MVSRQQIRNIERKLGIDQPRVETLFEFRDPEGNRWLNKEMTEPAPSPEEFSKGLGLGDSDTLVNIIWRME